MCAVELEGKKRRCKMREESVLKKCSNEYKFLCMKNPIIIVVSETQRENYRQGQSNNKNGIKWKEDEGVKIAAKLCILWRATICKQETSNGRRLAFILLENLLKQFTRCGLPL
jgi:hypothetical protein